jgi:hypothetical protein
MLPPAPSSMARLLAQKVTHRGHGGRELSLLHPPMVVRSVSALSMQGWLAGFGARVVGAQCPLASPGDGMSSPM